jgi:catechol-2,3-dioxygenase
VRHTRDGKLNLATTFGWWSSGFTVDARRWVERRANSLAFGDGGDHFRKTSGSVGRKFAVIKAKRLRYARVSTPDLARQVEYYRDVIGLAVVMQDSERAFLASEAGQVTLIFERGPTAALAALSLDLSPGLEASKILALLERDGVRAEIRSDVGPGLAQIIRAVDMDGRALELRTDAAFTDNRQSLPGVAPLKLGHIACYTADPGAISKYYGQLLGLRVSDWIEDRFVFMRCGYEHHTVNFARGEQVRMHHMAFELRDAAHMHRACDILGARKIPILWGPVRHGPGHNIAIYHRDPDGHVVEMFYDMDRMIDEDLGFYDPRPWHRDRPQKPKVWTEFPRDVWGGPPSPDLPEFYRMRPKS